MTLDRMGEPFKGKIWYWRESSFGGGKSGATLPISCKVQNVRINTGDRHKTLKGIESSHACHLLKLAHEPGLHLEYIPQADDTLIDDVIDRSSCCTLKSLAFAVGFNTCLPDADNRSYFDIKGAKPETVRINASYRNEYMVTIDFMAKSVATVASQTGVEPTALTGDYLAFNIAGEITKTGGFVVNTDHIAFVTDSIDITISHKLRGYTDHDGMYRDFILEGDMDIEGSVDISLDGGGANHITEVLNNTSFTITVNMGDSGAPRLTLPNCEWQSSSPTKDTGGEGMFDSAPFTCKPSSCSNIVSSVP